MTQNSGGTFSNAQAYEGYVGRWSYFVARQFIPWLEAAPGLTWLDVGAGTGILTQAILEQAAPAKVIAVDLSADYIDFARGRIHDERVEFRVEDAAKIAIEVSFDAAVAGLVLNFLPSPEQGLNNMVQAVKSGGIVAAYVWDYSGRMEMMRHFWVASGQVDPVAKEMEAAQQFALCRPENLRTLFESAGLNSVDVIPIDVPTRFADFDDYWLPFLAAQGSVSKYLRGIQDDTRSAIRDQLQRQLPIAADGTIALTARAWAVKGTK
ncbi:MAG: class I SAM-dependent methyltransferase, partial [Anaerolineae bacterium]|nr:class I SAM-dependent methyltransferase [Anaerolineae bacterium]